MKKRDVKAQQKEQKNSLDVNSCEQTDNKFISIKKGKAAVDEICYQKLVREIYTDALGNQYSAYLMNSDIKDNKNKFYILQLHKEGSKYYIYTRYGRVGESGVQNSELLNLEDAIKDYHKTFRSKTSKAKNYLPIQLKIEDGKKQDNAQKQQQKVENVKFKPSKLDKSVQDLIEFIYDKKLMEQQVMSAGYDPKKLPLGNLSDDTVKLGYKFLCEIEDILNKPLKTGGYSSLQISQLEELSAKFYTFIPHDFGRQNMRNFVINTLDKLKQKIDLIQSLIDINIAFKASDSKKKAKESKKKGAIVVEDHPLDKNYDALKCNIKTIDNKSEIYKIINQYIQNTSSGQKLKLLDCFELEREGEEKIFNPLDLKNHKLLWHGSRFSNYVGILSNGMRIAPPEAPRHGYALGKGAYFADLISKSINYCDTYSSKSIGFLVLCQIALGKCHKLNRHDSNADIYVKKNFKDVQSTHAQGRQVPNPKDDKIVQCKVNGKNHEYKIPLGKIIEKKEGIWSSEFVVYNTNQIKLRYLVKVKRD